MRGVKVFLDWNPTILVEMFSQFCSEFTITRYTIEETESSLKVDDHYYSKNITKEEYNKLLISHSKSFINPKKNFFFQVKGKSKVGMLRFVDQCISVNDHLVDTLLCFNYFTGNRPEGEHIPFDIVFNYSYFRPVISSHHITEEQSIAIENITKQLNEMDYVPDFYFPESEYPMICLTGSGNVDFDYKEDGHTIVIHCLFKNCRDGYNQYAKECSHILPKGWRDFRLIVVEE